MNEHLRAGRGIARAELAGEMEGELHERMDVGEGRMNGSAHSGEVFDR